MGALHEVPLQFPEMTTGPLRLGAGFLVFTHRVFQGNAIWGEGRLVPASTRSIMFTRP